MDFGMFYPDIRQAVLKNLDSFYLKKVRGVQITKNDNFLIIFLIKILYFDLIFRLKIIRNGGF